MAKKKKKKKKEKKKKKSNKKKGPIILRLYQKFLEKSKDYLKVYH